MGRQEVVYISRYASRRWGVFLCHCLVLMLLTLGVFCRSSSAAPMPNVLVLHSYHQGYSWTDRIMEGIFDGLGENEEKVEYHIEYMDTKRLSRQWCFESLKKTLLEKYKKISFFLVLAVDDNALDFVLQYRGELFRDIPVVFCGINDFKADRIAGFSGMTGVAENLDIRATLDAALTMLPGTRTVVSVSGGDESSRANLARLQRLYPEYLDRVNFVELHDMRHTALVKRLEALPANSVVIHLSYFLSPDGVLFSPSKSVRWVSEASRVPVFGVWDFMFGNGILGGMITSGFEQGRVAGKLASRILDGEDPSSIPVVRNSPNRLMFDYNELKRFGISEKRVPKAGEIAFRPESFFWKYKRIVVPTLALIGFMAISIIILFLNIRAKKRVQAQLKDSREFLDRIIDRIADPVFVKDASSAYVIANRAFCTLVGHRREVILGRGMGFFFPRDVAERSRTRDFAVLESGEEDVCEECLVESSGQPRFFEILRAGFRDNQGQRFVVGVCRDISQRKEAEAAILDAKRRSDQASQAKSEFLANMSHELRTPLNGVLGMLQLLEDTELSPGQREYAQTALRSGRNLLGILSDILDLAKIESGTLAMDEEPFAVRPFLDEMATIYVVEGRRRSLAFDFQVEDEVPEQLLTDPVRLRQILFNLVGNAVKFTGSGGRITVRLGLLSRWNGQGILWGSVTDTGQGIPEESIPSLFESFTQVDGSLSRKFGGVGLGLSIVRRLVELLHGEVLVHSAPGEGTEIEFTLRVGIPESGFYAEHQEKNSETQQLPKRVLVAEDDPVGRKLVVAILSKFGVDVRGVGDGEAVLRELETEEFDCVVMDIQMPGMDGLEATRLIRGSGTVWADIPIIALTAHAMQGDREQYLAGGMDDYITKPVDIDELRAALCRAVIPVAASPARQ